MLLSLVALFLLVLFPTTLTTAERIARQSLEVCDVSVPPQDQLAAFLGNADQMTSSSELARTIVRTPTCRKQLLDLAALAEEQDDSFFESGFKKYCDCLEDLPADQNCLIPGNPGVGYVELAGRCSGTTTATTVTVTTTTLAQGVTTTSGTVQYPDNTNPFPLPEELTLLGLCEADCDDDSQCQEGLMCVQRDKGDALPRGCIDPDGRGIGPYLLEWYTDICQAIVKDEDLVPVNLVTNQSFNGTLGKCEGPCRRNSDCGDGLMCFDSKERDPGHAPIGCTWKVEPRENLNICVEQDKVAPIYWVDENPVPYNTHPNHCSAIHAEVAFEPFDEAGGSCGLSRDYCRPNLSFYECKYLCTRYKNCIAVTWTESLKRDQDRLCFQEEANQGAPTCWLHQDYPKPLEEAEEAPQGLECHVFRDCERICEQSLRNLEDRGIVCDGRRVICGEGCFSCFDTSDVNEAATWVRWDLFISRHADLDEMSESDKEGLRKIDDKCVANFVKKEDRNNSSIYLEKSPISNFRDFKSVTMLRNLALKEMVVPSLYGLENLEQIEELFFFQTNSISFQSLEGLNSLRHVGQFHLFTVAVSDYAYLDALETVDYSFLASTSVTMVNLRLPSLKSVGAKGACINGSKMLPCTRTVGRAACLDTKMGTPGTNYALDAGVYPRYNTAEFLGPRSRTGWLVDGNLHSRFPLYPRNDYPEESHMQLSLRYHIKGPVRIIVYGDVSFFRSQIKGSKVYLSDKNVERSFDKTLPPGSSCSDLEILEQKYDGVRGLSDTGIQPMFISRCAEGVSGNIVYIQFPAGILDLYLVEVEIYDDGDDTTCPSFEEVTDLSPQQAWRQWNDWSCTSGCDLCIDHPELLTTHEAPCCVKQQRAEPSGSLCLSTFAKHSDQSQMANLRNIGDGVRNTCSYATYRPLVRDFDDDAFPADIFNDLESNCTACPPNTYMDEEVHRHSTCFKVKNCKAGEFETLEPTPTSNRMCSVCPPGQFNPGTRGLNLKSCFEVSECASFQLQEAPPTLSSDRICLDAVWFCPSGDACEGNDEPTTPCFQIPLPQHLQPTPSDNKGPGQHVAGCEFFRDPPSTLDDINFCQTTKLAWLDEIKDAFGGAFIDRDFNVTAEMYGFYYPEVHGNAVMNMSFHVTTKCSSDDDYFEVIGFKNRINLGFDFPEAPITEEECEVHTIDIRLGDQVININNFIGDSSISLRSLSFSFNCQSLSPQEYDGTSCLPNTYDTEAPTIMCPDIIILDSADPYLEFDRSCAFYNIVVNSTCSGCAWETSQLGLADASIKAQDNWRIVGISIVSRDDGLSLEDPFPLSVTTDVEFETYDITGQSSSCSASVVVIQANLQFDKQHCQQQGCASPVTIPTNNSISNTTTDNNGEDDSALPRLCPVLPGSTLNENISLVVPLVQGQVPTTKPLLQSSGLLFEAVETTIVTEIVNGVPVDKWQFTFRISGSVVLPNNLKKEDLIFSIRLSFGSDNSFKDISFVLPIYEPVCLPERVLASFEDQSPLLSSMSPTAFILSNRDAGLSLSNVCQHRSDGASKQSVAFSEGSVTQVILEGTTDEGDFVTCTTTIAFPLLKLSSSYNSTDLMDSVPGETYSSETFSLSIAGLVGGGQLYFCVAPFTTNTTKIETEVSHCADNKTVLPDGIVPEMTYTVTQDALGIWRIRFVGIPSIYSSGIYAFVVEVFDNTNVQNEPFGPFVLGGRDARIKDHFTLEVKPPSITLKDTQTTSVNVAVDTDFEPIRFPISMAGRKAIAVDSAPLSEVGCTIVSENAPEGLECSLSDSSFGDLLVLQGPASTLGEFHIEFSIEPNDAEIARVLVNMAAPLKVTVVECDENTCLNDGQCLPGDSPFDGVFTCDCSPPFEIEELTGLCTRLPNNNNTVTGSEKGSEDGSSIIAAVVSVAAVLFCVGLIIGILFVRRYWKGRAAYEFNEQLKALQDEGLKIEGAKSTAPLEIPASKVAVLETLGSGAGGEVCRGLVQWKDKFQVASIPVAIKRLKADSPNSNRDAMLAEAMLMTIFDHENVTNLVGVVTKNHQCMVILELCEIGSLVSMLRENPVPGKAGSVQILSDVAKGMEYLSNLGFVHRDLAARNVLISSSWTCKVADFGMSRILKDTDSEGEEEKDYYRMTSQDLIPIRWCPPEVINESKFSWASDVWAYGIMTHEVYTQAAIPYSGKNTVEIIALLRSNWRLPCPEICPQDIYENHMKACWASDPSKRPTFGALASELNQRLNKRGTTGPERLGFGSYATKMPQSQMSVNSIGLSAESKVSTYEYSEAPSEVDSRTEASYEYNVAPVSYEFASAQKVPSDDDNGEEDRPSSPRETIPFPGMADYEMADAIEPPPPKPAAAGKSGKKSKANSMKARFSMKGKKKKKNQDQPPRKASVANVYSDMPEQDGQDGKRSAADFYSSIPKGEQKRKGSDFYSSIPMPANQDAEVRVRDEPRNSAAGFYSAVPKSQTTAPQQLQRSDSSEPGTPQGYDPLPKKHSPTTKGSDERVQAALAETSFGEFGDFGLEDPFSSVQTALASAATGGEERHRLSKDDVGKACTVTGYDGVVGEIRFFGRLVSDEKKKRVGVAFDSPIGKNDGTFKGHRYFDCLPNHGVMVGVGKVQLVQGREESEEYLDVGSIDSEIDI